MKVNEVAQDDDNIFEGKTKSIQYAIDDNGNYTQVKSVGLEAQNIALELAWEEVNLRIDNAYDRVVLGEKSPVFYFMEKEIMDINILSETVAMPSWIVWFHLKPFYFYKLSTKTLNKYCSAFNLSSIAELKELPTRK